MQQNLRYYRRKFYRNATVWCYKHNKFEEILVWMRHNNADESYTIIDTITPKMLTKKIGNVEFAILLEEGLICPDTNLPKIMKHLISSIMDRLLEEEQIYRIPKDIQL